MNNPSPTPDEFAQEAREALSRRPPMTPREHFTWMVRKGLIDARGRVTRLIGGSAEPEPSYETWTPGDDASDPNNAFTLNGGVRHLDHSKE